MSVDLDVVAAFREAPFEDYCAEFIRITNKRGEVVPFTFNEGQRAYEDEVQRRFVVPGLPIRTITLKARQIGFSTQSQARMIRDTTLNGNRMGLVVAHELGAAGGLFRIGQNMYARLPEDRELKPSTRYITRGRSIHFAPPERDAWMKGDLWPDSIYSVDTANEAQSGRSFTYHYLHLSEVAFWANFIDKMVGLMATVPDEPGTWINLESTANGANLFKEEWDKAVRGDSDFFPFFWPWWKESSYSLELTEAERASFKPGRGKFAEGERELLDPGPVDYFTNESVPLTLEQLAWRRRQLRKPGYSLDKFHQEYPSTPQEAFLASGRHVFDQKRVAQILVNVDISDPRLPDEEHPGPILGGFTASRIDRLDARGRTEIEVPREVAWTPEGEWDQAPWKLWLPRGDQGEPVLDTVKINGQDRKRQFIIGADASGGRMSEGATDADFHAAIAIDHRTREQVVSYRSHIDPDEYARQLFMLGLFLAGGNLTMAPWIAVEVTGGWGLPIARRLYFDYRYPFVYIRADLAGRGESEDDRLGWNTGPNTKPVLIDSGIELIREGVDGIKDRELALEFTTFVRDDKGKTGAEPGYHDDLLMSWLIAQQIANSEALRPDWWGRGKAAAAAMDPRAYDL